MRPTRTPGIRQRRHSLPHAPEPLAEVWLTVEGDSDPIERRLLAGSYIQLQMQRARVRTLCDALGCCEPGSPTAYALSDMLAGAVRTLNSMPGGWA